MDKKIILNRIDELMKEKGITNYQLKEEAEISNTIYQWRKNATRDKTRVPSLRSIEKICDYFGVSLAYFFTFDKNGQAEVKKRELMTDINRMPEEQIDILTLLVKQFK